MTVVAFGIVRFDLGGGASSISVRRESRPTPITSASGPTVSPIERIGARALVLSTKVHGGGIAIADLEAGAVAEYPQGTIPWLVRSYVANAAITRNGDAVIWRFGDTTLHDGGSRDNKRSPLVARAGLVDPGRTIGTIVGDRWVVPTPSGTHVWILGESESPTGEKQLEYVDVATGAVELSTTVPDALNGRSSRLLGTADDDALIVPTDDVTPELLRITPAGTRSVVVAPNPDAKFVAMTGNTSVWIADRGQQLIVQRPGSTGIALPTPGFVWTVVGRVSIPSISPDLPVSSRDGSKLLLAQRTPSVSGDFHVYADSRVVVLDLERATVATALPPAQVDSAFWAQDGKTIVVVSRSGNGQTLRSYDTDTGRAKTIQGAIPEGYSVIAGG